MVVIILLKECLTNPVNFVIDIRPQQFSVLFLKICIPSIDQGKLTNLITHSQIEIS